MLRILGLIIMRVEGYWNIQILIQLYISDWNCLIQTVSICRINLVILWPLMLWTEFQSAYLTWKCNQPWERKVGLCWNCTFNLHIFLFWEICEALWMIWESPSVLKGFSMEETDEKQKWKYYVLYKRKLKWPSSWYINNNSLIRTHKRRELFIVSEDTSTK